MSKFHFIYPREVSFESWDWRNPRLLGIGGSETSVIEMSFGLGRRGHQVTVWSPCPEDSLYSLSTPVVWNNIDDLSLDNLQEDGVWIIYRYPPFLDHFQDRKRKDQQVWLVCQDQRYRTWSESLDGTQDCSYRMDLVDKVICLCKAHKEEMERERPRLKGKIVQSSNGICSSLLRDLLAKSDLTKRNPNKLLYPSSPDRGLDNLLKVFERAREYNPDLELEVAYGFDNLNRILNKEVVAEPGIDLVIRKRKDQLMGEMERLGVKVLGRLTQPDLWRKWLETGIWCYPTRFFETSCIVSMEAQVLGAIPIVTPKGAVGENVQHGFHLPGDVRESGTVLARFVGELVRMSTHPEWQEEIREKMMPWALDWFSWENFVRQWEDLAVGVEKDVQSYQA